MTEVITNRIYTENFLLVLGLGGKFRGGYSNNMNSGNNLGFKYSSF